MAIGLSATVELSAGAGSLPRVRLDVTGAPTGPAANYASNFATVDGWTTGANGSISVAGGVATFAATAAPTAVFSRTVTGLTIGTSYRLSLELDPQVAGAQVQIGESVLGTYTAWLTPAGYSPLGSYYALTYTWTATATSHTIQVRTRPATGAPYTQAFLVRNVRVLAASWAGTRITRTDVNGTAVPVRAGTNTGSAAFTVYDYEAALVGDVTYTATDGNGVAAASTTSHAWYWTNLVAYPSGELANAATERRRNVATNPSASINTANTSVAYGTGGAGTLTRQTGGSPAAGGTFFRQSWTTAPTALSALYVYASTTRAAAVPGEVWSGSVSFRSNVSGEDHRVTIYFYDAGGTALTITQGATVASVAGTWQTVSVSGAVAPANTASVIVLASQPTGPLPTTSTTHDYTLFTLVKEPTALPGFDGDTPDAAGNDYAWTGTAGASASTLSASSPAGWAVGFSTNNLTRDPSVAKVGSYSIRGDWIAGGAGQNVALTNFPTTIGETYTAGAWLRVPAGHPDVSLCVYFNTNGPTVTDKDAWTWSTHTFVANGSTTSVGMVNRTTATAGQVAYLDGLVVVKGSSLPPFGYFDGDTDPAPPVNASTWTGTPHASTSIASDPKAAPGVWLTIPASAVAGTTTPPAARAIPLVLDYSESRDSVGTLHQVIGRADKLGNPGPLSTRSGQVTLFCLSYDQAKAVVDLLEAGDTALLRQPDYAGLDVYLSPTRATARPNADARLRWAVDLAFEEVAAP